MIDAHQHFWDPARGDYGWLQPGAPLWRAYLPADLERHLAGQGVQGGITVQAAATVAETDFLLDLARESRFILGVVGWVDLSAPSAPAHIEARAQDPLFVGVRPMLQDLGDPEWILGEALGAGLEAIAAAGLVFDALIRADQIMVIETLARRHRDLVIVLDHAGKPPFGDARAMDRWRQDIASLARQDNVLCKLSGLATELPPGAPIEVIESCIEQLVGHFGGERLIWGSDWPVATTAITYGDWLAICRRRIEACAPAHCDAVFGGAARQVYRIAPAAI
ncbi:MAG: amidohydrolase [Sphingomonas sanxanigenens]|uniref:Amidohydrolase n=1 Tax=Sphingomonas sanxanigenens TaxID=397260 RepID=A0A2W5AFB3_9SPHN|nr:MAG: amidohydrolase [Sphingomonas sanxanigenens]